MPYVLPVTVYYEDTDFTGVVYHANYLKFFERAREELLGVERLADLYRDVGAGFVVYRVELKFREPAVHGDRLEIRTVVKAESEWRLSFDQTVWRPGGTQPAVQGTVEMVTVDRQNKLIPVPAEILSMLRMGA